MDNIITFASVTSAMKAKELLRTRQIGARMIRTPERGGGADSRQPHSLQGHFCR